MIWKIIISVVLWTFYIASAISVIFLIIVLFKVLIWDNIKKRFHKNKNKDILEKDPFEENE